MIAAAMDDLAAIVRAAEERGTVTLLGTIPPRGWSPESRPEAEYNRAVIALGRKLEVPVARIFEEIEAGGDRHRHI